MIGGCRNDRGLQLLLCAECSGGSDHVVDICSRLGNAGDENWHCQLRCLNLRAE